MQQPNGVAEHRVVIWDQPCACDILIGGVAPLKGRGHSLIVIPAHSPMEATPTPATRYTKLSISPAYTEKIAQEVFGLSKLSVLPFTGDADIAFGAMGRMLVDSVTGHAPLDLDMIEVISREAAIRLIQGYSDHPSQPEIEGKLSLPSLIRVLDYIAAHLHEPITVDSLARQAGLSRWQFSRRFAKSTGRSPHAYLIARRIAKAAHLLLHSPLPIDQIAEECGFHDQAHFTRNFKLRIGQTPGDFRKGRRT